MRGNLSADNGAPLYQAALAGLGIARLPSFYEIAYTMEGMSYVLEDYAVTRGVYAVYPDAPVAAHHPLLHRLSERSSHFHVRAVCCICDQRWSITRPLVWRRRRRLFRQWVILFIG